MIAFWSALVRLAFLPFVLVGFVVILTGAAITAIGVHGIRFVLGDKA